MGSPSTSLPRPGFNAFDDDGHPKRTGTVGTTTVRIITALIGPGILLFAWNIAQLGWILGPTVTLFFSFVTYLSTLLLSACYRSGDRRNYTYMDAVKSNLGVTKSIIFGIVFCTYLFGVPIEFIQASSASMSGICWSSKCPHHSTGEINYNLSMLIFGIIQIFLSQIPDVSQYWFVIIVKIVLSFTYSMISIGLSIAKVAETGKFCGSLTGISVGSTLNPTMIRRRFKALGAIGFAYSFSHGLFEIQDTIKSSPTEANSMKMALQMGIVIATILYTLCGCFGYAAFGDSAPTILLTDFFFYKPNWFITIAHAALFMHLTASYQAYCQPFFLFIEKLVTERFPDTIFVTHETAVRIPGFQSINLKIFRLVLSTIYVIITIVISKFVPFFSKAVDVIRALGFYLLSVYFPIEIYIQLKQIPRWSSKWVFLQILNFSFLVITIATATGSIAEIITDFRP